MNGDFSTTSNTMNMDIANNASNSTVFIKNDGAGKANLNVEGNITGGSLGTSGSRWSTIYADTVNFLTGLTNSDNTSGSNSAINLGTAGADNAEVHIGNSNANVSLDDADWSIASNGDANLADLIVMGNVDGDSLSITNNATIGGTLGLDGKLTITAGGFDIAGDSDMRGDIDMHGNVLTNIGDNATDFTGSGGLNLAGTLNANGGIDLNNHDLSGAKDIDASGTISGTIDADGGYNNNIAVKGSDGNNCNINVEHGIITGTTCP